MRRVTWHVRYRCLRPVEGANAAASPQECPECFIDWTYFSEVRQEFGQPFSISGPPFYLTAGDPILNPRSFSFAITDAPSARWCIDGWVELTDGQTLRIDAITQLLTGVRHNDTGFMVTQAGGTRRVVAEVIATHDCYGRRL